MSIPTAVTQRAEGTGYIGVTGMEFAVQTGFAIRTGFYLTNSGTTSVRMTLELDSSAHNFDQTYDFISGTYDVNDDRRVTILAGSTKFIPFDFYGLKSTSGPQSPITGPAGTGSYNTAINLSFISEIDGTQDRTYYAGQPELGVIRVNLTGYVTGHFGSTSELTPAHPQKFLGITGQKDDFGVYYHDLRWVNPPTGYYFEKYKIERSTDATQNWSALTTIEIPKIDRPTTLPPAVGGTYLNSFYYGTPTGIDGYNTYSDTNLTASTDYYYRIRGEHYDSSNTSTLISYSDWVYCSGVDSFSQSVSNDVLTGLVSGSTNLEPGDNPDPTIKLSTAEKGALEIYLQDGESNVILKDRFETEINKRNISKSNFLDYYTGVHFIIDENSTIGSSKYEQLLSNSPKIPAPAIKTGAVVNVGPSLGSELQMNLYLKNNAKIIGLGGVGGNAGIAKVVWTDSPSSGGGISFDIQPAQYGKSTDGGVGGNAIEIASGINNFRIYLPSIFSIYAGGGGGGGGDRLFAARAASQVRQAKQDRDIDLNTPVYLTKSENKIILDINAGGKNSLLAEFDFSDFAGIQTAGFGGGGQGSFKSDPGSTYQQGINTYQKTAWNETNKGNTQRAGAGRSFNLNYQISQGGAGGAFGQYGDRAPDSSFDDGLFTVISSTSNDEVGKLGGRGGFAVKSASSAYTTSNLIGALFFPNSDFQPENIGNFIARWDASTTVYNTGTTDATNGQDVETWVAAAKNSALSAVAVQIVGDATNKPKFYNVAASDNAVSRFNGKPCIQFDNLASAVINGIYNNSTDYTLTNNTEAFDIFYLVFPDSFGSKRQFNADNKKIRSQNLSFTKFNSNNNVSYLYNASSEIKESTGMPNRGNNYSVETSTSENADELMPSYAFVYNVAASKDGRKLVYKSFINNISKGAKELSNQESFKFDINPIIGANNGTSSFSVSDIIIYNKQLKNEERNAVYLYLRQRAMMNINIITTEDIDTTTSNNKAEDETGFAGYFKLTS